MSYTVIKTVKFRTENGTGLQTVELEDNEVLLDMSKVTWLISEVGSVEPPARTESEITLAEDEETFSDDLIIETPGVGQCHLSIVVTRDGTFSITTKNEHGESVECYVNAKVLSDMERAAPPVVEPEEPVEEEKPEEEEETPKEEEEAKVDEPEAPKEEEEVEPEAEVSQEDDTIPWDDEEAPAESEEPEAQDEEAPVETKSTLPDTLVNRKLQLDITIGTSLPVKRTLDLYANESLKSIYGVVFHIAERGTVEPPITVEVPEGQFSQPFSGADGELEVTLPREGLCSFVYSIRRDGVISVSLSNPETRTKVRAMITALVSADVEVTPPPKQTPYTHQRLASPKLKEHDMSKTKPFYHLGQDSTIFAVGLSADVSRSELVDQLSDRWVADDVAKLSKSEQHILTTGITADVSIQRAVRYQDTFDAIVRGIYGIATLIAEHDGTTYYLPLVGHSGTVVETALLGSLDFEYWNRVDQLMSTELQEIERNGVHNEQLLNIQEALTKQMDWTFSSRSQ